MVVAALTLAWLLGSYLALTGDVSGDLIAPLAGIGLAAVPISLLVWSAPRVRLAVLAAACLSLGVARALSAQASLTFDPLSGIEGDVELLCVVATPPDRLGDRLTLVLDVRARVAEGGWVAQEGRVWLQMYGGLPLTYGDAIIVRGRLTEPRSRPGYPLPTILRTQGIRYIIDRPRVTLVERRDGDALWEALHGAREAISSAIRRQLPEPHASLLAGVLVGTRAQMPQELRQALVATGTSHIVAVSGFNVAIVAGLVTAGLAGVAGRRYALLPALLAIAIYTALTGPPPSAVRAALMASAALVATGVGRIADPLTSLLVAGSLMVALDPFQVLDLGFQLSFLATAGLILFQSPLAAVMPTIPRVLRDDLSVTLAAQIATLPLIMSTFHTLSLVSPLANLLVAPALPPLMLLGALLAATSPFSWLGPLVAWPCWALLSYVLAVIGLVGSLPGALVPVGAVPATIVAGLFGTLVLLGLLALPEVRGVLGRLPRWQAWRAAGMAALAVSLAALGVLGVSAARPDGWLRASVLDVGGSLVVLVRTPSGRTALLVNGAPTSQLNAVLATRLRPWESRLGAVALNKESDLVALRRLLGRYPTEAVILPGAARSPDPIEQGVLRLADGARVELDQDVWLAAIFSSREAGTLAGWRLGFGSLALTIAIEDPAAMPAVAADSVGLGALVLTDGRFQARQPEIGGQSPRLVIRPGSGSDGQGVAASWLELGSGLHGDVDLESDGLDLIVRPQRCAAPVEPPRCALALGPGG